MVKVVIGGVVTTITEEEHLQQKLATAEQSDNLATLQAKEIAEQDALEAIAQADADEYQENVTRWINLRDADDDFESEYKTPAEISALNNAGLVAYMIVLSEYCHAHAESRREARLIKYIGLRATEEDS